MLSSGLTRALTAVVAVMLVLALPAVAGAQVRTTGQIVGAVKDASGAVVPNAELLLQDVGTGITAEGKSGPDGTFVFPNLQPGTYQLIATATGFEALTVNGLVVQTSRITNVELTFKVAGVQEQVTVQAVAPVVEATSTTVATTVRNEQVAKLPLNGRSVLNFALLTPGASSSESSGRYSTFNGLPGGAIALTLDGVNNNSQRFRSGGTSFFSFAPVRLGAIEEVTISTGGLTADAGAEGAIQVQFVTKRGTNAFRGQLMDQIRHEGLNANSVFNRARGLPVAKFRQHEYGGNIGGPIIRNKLFFFGNFEQTYQPGQSTLTATVLNSGAQQGEFRYVATDGSTRSVNVLDIARGYGYPSTIDPYVAQQLAAANATLGQGSVAARDLQLDELRWLYSTNPFQIFPTARVDYQVNKSLAVRGSMNARDNDTARSQALPGSPLIFSGYHTTAFVVSTGADWVIRSNMFNQFTFGVQSNYEEFNPGNSLDLYASQGGRRIALPLVTSPVPTGDVMPLPRNNPVFNASNTITWLKGTHNITAGGTLRYTRMYENFWQGAAGGPQWSLGIATGDPAANIFTASTMPGVRTADLARAQTLYALLTGRVSGISGILNVNEETMQYGENSLNRREAQTVGGLFLQDSWRVNPSLTLNYGLRWEFSGAAHNTNDIYASPDYANLLGPSKELFKPGVLDGVQDPRFDLNPKPYKSDLFNPAPNLGVAWRPSAENGFLAKLLGDGKSVLRGSIGLNYYDEGLVAFQQSAGSNRGMYQQTWASAGQHFTAGSLLLGSPTPALSTFPTEYGYPLPMSMFTFAGGYTAIDPNIKTPYVLNWNIGWQRELWRDAAIEARYVGNHGFKLWRSYDLNEINIFENGFLDEFKAAQNNLKINRANGLSGFGNNNLPGQTPLPIFEAAFGPNGAYYGALPAASGFNNSTFINYLDQGQAGRLASSFAGNSTYLCRMVGSALPGCASYWYNGPGNYPINFFQANPFAAGSSIAWLTNAGESKYNGMQLQFRQRARGGLTVTASYTYSKTTSDRYSDSPYLTGLNYYTLRDKERNWAPGIYDIRHAFQAFWTYELPFGDGRHFATSNKVLDYILGGWNASGILRIQSGRPFFLSSGRWTFNNRESGVILNGITRDELQKMVNIRPGPTTGTIYFFDQRVIGADGRGNPEFLKVPTTPGEMGDMVYLYGPGFWNLDLGVSKQFRTPGRTYLNFEAMFLNALNHPNFLVGGASSDTGFSHSIDSTTFGQTTSTASGPRNIQLRLQFGF